MISIIGVVTPVRVTFCWKNCPVGYILYTQGTWELDMKYKPWKIAKFDFMGDSITMGGHF